jgi:CBS domain-containing protein
MRLSDFVKAPRAVVPLPAEDDTLPAAARTLILRLATAGAVSDPDKLLARMAEERPEDVVAMGERAFLLHFRTDTVPDLVVAMGTTRAPICRELGQDDQGQVQVQCARILVMVAAPPRQATTYLQLVGAFARFFQKEARVDAVLAQPNAEALEELPDFHEWVLPEQLLVRDIMTQRPRAVPPDMPVRQAAADMVRFGIGGLPVTDADGQIVGMLSEKELLRHLQSSYLQAGAASRPLSPGVNRRQLVRDVMTRQVLCVSPEQPLAEVASIMTNKDVERVPVVTGGRLVGYLTRGDIVRKLMGS